MSKAEFIRIVTNNLLPNCPVTQQDIMASEDIYRPDVGSVKGKTVRRRPLRVECGVTYTPLPSLVQEHYKEINMTADIIFVNAIPCFVSLSRKIEFGTIETLDQQTEREIIQGVSKNSTSVPSRRIQHSPC